MLLAVLKTLVEMDLTDSLCHTLALVTYWAGCSDSASIYNQPGMTQAIVCFFKNHICCRAMFVTAGSCAILCIKPSYPDWGQHPPTISISLPVPTQSPYTDHGQYQPTASNVCFPPNIHTLDVSVSAANPQAPYPGQCQAISPLPDSMIINYHPFK